MDLPFRKTKCQILKRKFCWLGSRFSWITIFQALKWNLLLPNILDRNYGKKFGKCRIFGTGSFIWKTSGPILVYDIKILDYPYNLRFSTCILTQFIRSRHLQHSKVTQALELVSEKNSFVLFRFGRENIRKYMCVYI